jgi:hypothetical protein
LTFLETTIKTVLSKDYPNCQQTIYSKDRSQWCFETITYEILGLVGVNSSVTVGKSNKCYSASQTPTFTHNESYLFLLGDIYVEIIKFA